MSISPSLARRVVIRSQGLAEPQTGLSGTEGAARIVEQLGYVQIDTIAVVERAHHHVIWARYPDYEPAMLHELQARDRRVFEGWSHAASYLPTRDYRFYRAHMIARAHDPRIRQYLKEQGRLVKAVRERIRAEGPLTAADFEAPEGFKRGSWWNWKPAKRVLELLFLVGDLMVSERRNFHRVYDLTERVLPPDTDRSAPNAQELRRFVLRRELAANGLIPVDPQDWLDGKRPERRKALEELVEMGEAVFLDLEGSRVCARPRAVEDADRSELDGAVSILSPFDNLIIRRNWLKALFGFDYRIECYTPAPKRRYGYFTLPVLWGDRFIGRIDAKAERKEKALLLRHLSFEPGLKDYADLCPVLARQLIAFATFNGCNHVNVERTTPTKAAKPLIRALTAR